MKASNIAQAPLVKRCGARRAKLFAKIWFSIMYLMLTAATAGLWIASPEFTGGWPRIFVGCIVGALVVFAASLLTRMRLRFLSEIEQLETREKIPN
jgi:hypothetical protein